MFKTLMTLTDLEQHRDHRWTVMERRTHTALSLHNWKFNRQTLSAIQSLFRVGQCELACSGTGRVVNMRGCFMNLVSVLSLLFGGSG